MFWLNQINGHSPKYSDSRACIFPLFKECNIPPFFLQGKHVDQAGPDLQLILVVASKYDSRLTLLLLVGAEGPANWTKPEEFPLQLCLIEGGLLLPPDVKVLTSTARCDSLQKKLNAIKLSYYYLSTSIFTGRNCCGQQLDVLYIIVCSEF